jgi:uncharacterized repeat protein (TIGR01451 family)
VYGSDHCAVRTDPTPRTSTPSPAHGSALGHRITKTPSTSSPNNNQAFTYTVLQNYGPNAATNIQVTDVLNLQLTYPRLGVNRFDIP